MTFPRKKNDSERRPWLGMTILILATALGLGAGTGCTLFMSEQEKRQREYQNYVRQSMEQRAIRQREVRREQATIPEVETSEPHMTVEFGPGR